jgi:flagellar basal-body rod protein FlgB
MWTHFLQNTSLPAVEQTIYFAERRHGLLASNVANADTPDYQTRDLSVTDFQESLKDLVEAHHRSPSSSSQSTHRSSSPSQLTTEQATRQVRENMKQILYHDGSDVGLETQVTEIAKNQSMHTTAVAILRQQMGLLQMAITGTTNV